MALITCPECGGKISSSAKQCIHCGCEIKLCPECNNVYMANAEECKQCGFKFEKQIKNELIEKQEDCIQVYNKFKSMNSISNILFNYLGGLLNILGTILVSIAGVKLFRWSNGDALSGIFKYKEVKSNINTLIIISMLLTLLGRLMNYFDTFFLSYVFNPWCNLNKRDLAFSIKNYLVNNNFTSKTKEGLKKDTEILNKCIDCEMMKDIVFKEKCKKRIIVSSIISVISLIFWIVFLTGAVNDIMQRILVNAADGLTLKSIGWIKGWWSIIIAILLEVIDTIFIEQKSKTKQDTRNQFIKKNIPDGYDNYIKYFNVK